ncbi:hypothetical protein Taro_009222 [Colocasia esculenta]|uniref:Uncharacterized protein n=1 Tax=Colocasia esculenta TaxID=4460 RepID=A0A843U9D8_COLES|nr:hypothetical protein [Colocasia esculenta]
MRPRKLVGLARGFCFEFSYPGSVEYRELELGGATGSGGINFGATVHPEEMGSSFEICEITESKDELDLLYHSKGLNPIKCKPKMDVRDGKQTRHDEHELSQLIETVDRRMSRIRVPQQHGMDLLRKHALKKPVRGGASQVLGTGISESVTLKQALRRLCISQASETAAMKRFSRPIRQSGVSEAGTIKRLYAAVVVQANQSLDEEKGKLLEISLVPEKAAAEVPCQRAGSSDVPGVNKPNKSIETFPHSSADITRRGMKPRIQDVISSASPDSGSKSEALVGQIIKGKSNSHLSTSSCKPGGELSKAHIGPRLIKPIFVNKNIRKKLRHGSAPVSGSYITSDKVNKVDAAATEGTVGSQKKECTLTLATNVNHSTIASTTKGCTTAIPESTPTSGNTDRVFGGKTGEGLKTREKGECSQSSKSSLGDYSSSTSISDESNQSTSSGHGNRSKVASTFVLEGEHVEDKSGLPGPMDKMSNLLFPPNSGHVVMMEIDICHGFDDILR